MVHLRGLLLPGLLILLSGCGTSSPVAKPLPPVRVVALPSGSLVESSSTSSLSAMGTLLTQVEPTVRTLWPLAPVVAGNVATWRRSDGDSLVLTLGSGDCPKHVLPPPPGATEDAFSTCAGQEDNAYRRLELKGPHAATDQDRTLMEGAIGTGALSGASDPPVPQR